MYSIGYCLNTTQITQILTLSIRDKRENNIICFMICLIFLFNLYI